MLSEVVIVAIVGSFGALGTATINSLSGKRFSKKLEKLTTKVDVIFDITDKISKHINVVTDNHNIIKKFQEIQDYYLENIPENYRGMAISLSASFIQIIEDFLEQNFDEVRGFNQLKIRVLSMNSEAHKRANITMGAEFQEKFFKRHNPNLRKWIDCIREVFFDITNSKKLRFTNLSLVFYQSFMEDFVRFDYVKELPDELFDSTCKFEKT